MIKKIKSFVSKIGNKGKAMLLSAIVAASSCFMSVAASAADTTSGSSSSFDFGTAMKTAGTSIQNQLGTLVMTLIPMMVGVVTVGLGIFGVVQLVKLMKKIFGQVTG